MCYLLVKYDFSIILSLGIDGTSNTYKKVWRNKKHGYVMCYILNTDYRD